MDLLLDFVERVAGSPLFEAAAAITLAAAACGFLLQEVRARQRILDFMEAHGFRWTGPKSTMRLARALERWGLYEISGYFDGRRVEVRTHTRAGRSITVTADRDLAPGEAGRVVSLGAWTHPKPPELLAGLSLSVTGAQLRVVVGDNFVPYISAAVAYAKALEEAAG